MIRYFTVPWDSGHRSARMGAGPSRLARELGIEADAIESGDKFPREIGTAFELYAKLATAVHECVATGDFPVVFSGNCGAINGLAAGLDELMSNGATRVLIHVDLDVLDPRYGRANEFAAEGGLSPDDVIRVIEIARRRFRVAALELASYDPACDGDGRVAQAGASIVRAIEKGLES